MKPGYRPNIRVRQVVLAIIAGCVSAWIFATAVFIDFEPIRIRLVREPAPVQEDVARVQIRDERTADLQPPFALIARLRNDAEEPLRFSIRLNDRPVCEVEVPAGRARRIDCEVGEWDRRPEDELAFEPASPRPWAIEYVEIATHHGRSSGWLEALVLPRGGVHLFTPPPRCLGRRCWRSACRAPAPAVPPFRAAVVARRPCRGLERGDGAVRCGGHCAARLAVPNRAVYVDVRLMALDSPSSASVVGRALGLVCDPDPPSHRGSHDAAPRLPQPAETGLGARGCRRDGLGGVRRSRRRRLGRARVPQPGGSLVERHVSCSISPSHGTPPGRRTRPGGSRRSAISRNRRIPTRSFRPIHRDCP